VSVSRLFKHLQDSIFSDRLFTPSRRLLAMLENATQCKVQRYENNCEVLNLITTTLGRNVYDRVSHLETAHDVWLKLCNTCEGSSEIKSSCKDTYNRQYQTFF
jgi:hypothetical protein